MLALLVSIPFIAGQWSLLEALQKALPALPPVSIPFIAGQWSLRGRRAPPLLHVQVSIPFIAGQWSLQIARTVPERDLVKFQSPSLRGSGRFVC